MISYRPFRQRPERASISTWRAPDGWLLRRMDWPQKRPHAVRGSILFAGGRADFIEKYLEALGHWHDRDWNVASFDWRGQGESRGDIVGGHLDSFDPLVEDLAWLVADWMSSTPSPHVLIGHSMGGHLVLRLLAEHSPPIDAAVLIAPMIGINSKPLSPAIGAVVAGCLATFGLSKQRAWKANEKPTLLRVDRQQFLTTSQERYEDEIWWKQQEPGFDLGPPSWGWLNAAYRSMRSLTPEKLRAIKAPLLIIGTDADRLVSPDAMRAAAKAIPDCELHMFADAAHEILRESDEVRIAAFDRIDAFLEHRLPQ